MYLPLPLLVFPLRRRERLLAEGVDFLQLLRKCSVHQPVVQQDKNSSRKYYVPIGQVCGKLFLNVGRTSKGRLQLK